MKYAALLILVSFVACSFAQRQLSLPDRNSCVKRVIHTRWGNHGYLFSWEHSATRNLEVDWLDARNICRRHCMDLVSLETPEENNFIKQRISSGSVRYIWTSGRKCNFGGCSHRPDLYPNLINGWFWSGSGAKIGAPNRKGNGDWSDTGGSGKPQPDNREIGQGNDEACLSVMNNFYNDGIKWHDIACNHLKPFVCEDSESLLRHVGL